MVKSSIKYLDGSWICNETNEQLIFEYSNSDFFLVKFIGEDVQVDSEVGIRLSNSEHMLFSGSETLERSDLFILDENQFKLWNNTFTRIKEFRLWKPIHFSDKWSGCDTSILDDISDSWFERREKLQENSQEYADFLEMRKREHAIETGIVERMYDLSKGVTETFIKEGFNKSYLSHGDTDISEDQLMDHLQDHYEAVNFVFDIVKENRPLSVSFVKQLHQLVTRHQDFTDAVDPNGKRVQIPLIKGDWKKSENNPERPDGIKVFYCPPEQVASEMDNLISIYNDLLERGVHNLLITAWFHHAFTIIHPFQDGNGRCARLLASLIQIKQGLFPITVLREEAKAQYIQALELADRNSLQPLVTYFAQVQRRYIEKALNLREVSSSSFEEVKSIFAKKVIELEQKKIAERQELLQSNRETIFSFCSQVLNELKVNLRTEVGSSAYIEMSSSHFGNDRIHEHSEVPYEDFFYSQIVSYAKKHDYFFNRTFPKAWITFRIQLPNLSRYQLGISIHHYGYDDSTLALGSFLEYKTKDSKEAFDTTLPLDIPPHVISISRDLAGKEKNIKGYLESAITLMMAQIASEI